MNKWMDGTLLASFEKSSSEEVRLTLHRWTVGQYLDMRIFSKVRLTDHVAAQPAEAGLCMSVDLLPDLRAAIDRAIVALGGKAEDKELVVRVVHTKEALK